jgi:urease accessory protein
MHTAASLLQLMWLASPALPVGSFSYSEGLEAAVEVGAVHDEGSAKVWLLDQLALSFGRVDLPVAAAAFEVWRAAAASGDTVDVARLSALNGWVHRTRETSELRRQTEQTARSLLEWLRTRDVDDQSGGAVADGRLAVLASLPGGPTWPVAFALAAERTGADRRDALLAMGFGWCENQVQAAIKAVPLGQSAGQRILAALAAALPSVVDAAADLPEADWQAFTPMLAILSSRHETQYSRLFRS